MDIALCKLEDGRITYAGANNPLWIVRKTAFLTPAPKEARSSLVEEDQALIEFKADKQPIGLYPNMKGFSETEIPLFEDDALYVFSDGFADQFGGPKGKKFKYRPFKQMLLSLNGLSPDRQMEKLKATFETCKGDFEQIDDVCVIGLRVQEYLQLIFVSYFSPWRPSADSPIEFNV